MRFATRSVALRISNVAERSRAKAARSPWPRSIPPQLDRWLSVIDHILFAINGIRMTFVLDQLEQLRPPLIARQNDQQLVCIRLAVVVRQEVDVIDGHARGAGLV